MRVFILQLQRISCIVKVAIQTKRKEVTVMFCKHCGAQQEENVKFCTACGQPLEQPAPVAPQPQPVQSQPVPTTPPYYNTPAPQIPPEYKPLSPWAYFGLSILFSIPIVGFIFLIVFSCNGSNLNRRNFARSYWCALILVAIFAVIVFLLAAVTGGAVSSSYYY